MGPSGRFTYVIVILMFETDYMQVLYLGRAPRTKETLPDFRKKYRVTRHSRVFRGLMGSQRTPGNWGVTREMVNKAASREEEQNSRGSSTVIEDRRCRRRSGISINQGSPRMGIRHVPPLPFEGLCLFCFFKTLFTFLFSIICLVYIFFFVFGSCFLNLFSLYSQNLKNKENKGNC